MRVANYFFDLLKCFLDAGKFTHPVTGPAHTVTNTWEANRDVLLTKGNIRNSDASDISSIGYTVNAIGQRTNATRTGAATNSTAWAYDNLGQLVQADDSAATSDRAYQYDSIGNREKTAAGTLELPGDPNYVANALNQYTTIPQAAATPIYDFDGNMTSGPLPVSPTTNSTLVWDAENRLVEIKNGATTLAAYSYDALSRRIAKIPASGSATLYLYDGFNCIAEYTGTTLAKTYLWGMDLSGSLQGAGGVGGLLAENHHAGPTTSTFYPCFDGNGNITEYLYPDGTVAAHFEYDPFGNTTVNTDTNNVFAYRFSTKPLDFETGLYYYNYRYYDPLTGHWPSRDAIGEMGGVNLYNYTNNRGCNAVDYLGLKLKRVEEDPDLIDPELVDPSSGNLAGHDASIIPEYPTKIIATYADTLFGLRQPVTVDGSMVIKMYMSNVLTNERTEVAKKHEREHYRIFKKWWNMVADEVNWVEYNWCPPCGQLATSYANKTLALRFRQADYENAELDKNAGANRWLEGYEKDVEAARVEYKAAMDAFYAKCVNKN